MSRAPVLPILSPYPTAWPHGRHGITEQRTWGVKIYASLVDDLEGIYTTLTGTAYS